jgi:hypothetical protein
MKRFFTLLFFVLALLNLQAQFVDFNTEIWKGILAAGDIDGDGDLDVIISGDAPGDKEAGAILINDGAGNFTPQIGSRVITAGRSGNIHLGDIDGDGDLTIADVNAWVGYPASEFFPETQYGSVSKTVMYEYDNTKIIIDGDKKTVQALQAGVHKVKATMEGSDAEFYVHSFIIDKTSSKFNTSPYDAYAAELNQRWLADGTTDTTTLFIGDSFFDSRYFWTDFYSTYAGKDALCFGISATTSCDWEVYLDEWLGNLSPKNIVMHIGTNNVYDDNESADEAVKSLQRMFILMHDKFPNVKIYYFGISQRSYDQERIERITSVNSDMQSWCAKRNWIVWLDTPSKLTADMLMDNVHPKPEYYSIFTDELARTDIVFEAISPQIKDIERTVNQMIGDNLPNLAYKRSPLKRNFVLNGKIDITQLGNNAHLEFRFGGYEYRMLLWNNESNNRLKVGYAYGSYNSDAPENAIYTFTPDQTLTLDFKLAVTDDDGYLYINGQLVLVFIHVSGTGDVNPLVISSESMGCKIYNMTACSKDFDSSDYVAAVSSMSETLNLYAGRSAGAYRPAASTPPLMGWSSWNANRVNISEALIKETADSLVSLGLKDRGYSWVNIDDGYFNGRDSDGNLQANAKFPNGMRAVSDYIHAQGLNAGIYSEIGRNTCASIHENDVAGKNSGLYGHEEQDLRRFFNTWNYDFIKVDYCGGIEQNLNEQTSYTNVGNIIARLETELGRDLRFNICRWDFPGTWARGVADSWRISGDIWDNFSSIQSIIEKNIYLAPYCSPGKYNDMDMLQLGRGLSNDEEKTHFAVWSIMSSPLVIGCNFANIRQSSLNILKNAEIIAVNQDPLGLQAEIVARDGKTMVFAKPIETAHGKIRAVALCNTSEHEKTVRVRFKDIWLSEKAKVRDLWEHSDLGEFIEYYETTVPPHGTAMLRIEGESATDKLRYQGEYAYMNKFSAINLASNARFEKRSEIMTSGGHVMGWLGNNPENWAEYRDVYLSEGGKYTFRLYYITGENRNLSIFVNGKEHKMTNLHSGGWTTRATKEIGIELNSGSNTIRFANDTGWTPDIDKFELIPEGGNIDNDTFDILDTSGQFPVISSTDNSNETWYNIQFKKSEGVLQDMGEDQFLLTKSLDKTLPSQQWKVVQVSNPSGDYKYQLLSRDGRALTRVSVPATADGFYKTTANTAEWEKFRIVSTGNNDLKPAWEIERQGANNRNLNQYNPTFSTTYDKYISEWDANDPGNPLIFIPATLNTAIKTVQNAVRATVSIDGKQFSIEGNDIKEVRVYTVSGSLVAHKAGKPFSFRMNQPGCYLPMVKYNDNTEETLKLIIN